MSDAPLQGTTAAPLLVELLVEELPARALLPVSTRFAEELSRELALEGFCATDAAVTPYATPRRLAVRIEGVVARAPDREVLVKGPSVKSGLGADGTPAGALVGFAKKRGVAVDALERMHDGKQEIFVHRDLARGGELRAVLAEKVGNALAKAAANFKLQRWGDGDAAFVRPVRGLVMLHGAERVEGEVLGQHAGRTTVGHRFLSHGTLTLAHADEYEPRLESEGRVVPAFAKRLGLIRERVAALTGAHTVAAGDALFDEVAGLVEWPAVYAGTFAQTFLEVPQECLMLTMKQNQKYFPLLDGAGKLVNRFLVVSNMDVPDPSQIIHGNERVLRARLADAKFFFEQDRRRRLETLVPELAAVVFHNKLGSQLARVERIEALAGGMAPAIGADLVLARRAARLAKADLLSGMVGEFPELQGIMGQYYARHDGEDERVAAAIEAHYRPRFAGDALPADRVGDAVALADKLDTLVGIWGIGLAPTGDKDPFALRRAALGVLRILVEHTLPVELPELLRRARAGHGDAALAEDTVDAVYAFMLDRLRGYLRERGFAADEIDAVLAQSPRRIDLVVPRIEAVQAFRAMPEAPALAAANKRTQNILRKSEAAAGTRVDTALFADAEEHALHAAIAELRSSADARIGAGEYTEALRQLARIRPQVDMFFDKVLVNAEDPAVRRNRLALLGELEHVLNGVADIARLAA
jgi:glycyl-tRNA synthetase beta chain